MLLLSQIFSFFLLALTLVHADCPVSCLTCDNNGCITCKDSSLFPANGVCSCSPLTMAPDGKCCHQSCAQCAGSNNPEECTSCNHNFLRVKRDNPNIGSCEQRCENGYNYNGAKCFIGKFDCAHKRGRCMSR